MPGNAQKRKEDGNRNGAKENKVSRGITDVEPRGSTRECKDRRKAHNQCQTVSGGASGDGKPDVFNVT